MANTTIAIKKSGTPSAAPSVLANGELALNYADGKLYYKNATGHIVSFSATAGGNSFGIANVDNTLILSGTGNDVLSFLSGNNITLSACTTTKTITINGITGSPTIPVSSIAPVAPSANSLWWNSNLGRLFIYYNDGDSNQWVEANPSGESINVQSLSDATGVGANNWANTKLSNTSGVSFAGDLYFPTGNIGIGTTTAPSPLTIIEGIVTPITLVNDLIDAEGNANSTVQLHVRNANTGTIASSDFIATADNGTDTTNFIDLGINGSGYNEPNWTINRINDGYLYVSDSNLSIGTANSTSVTKYVNFFVGGVVDADEVMRIQDSAGGANVGIGRTNPNYKLDVVGTVNAAAILINDSGVSTLGQAVAVASGLTLS